MTLKELKQELKEEARGLREVLRGLKNEEEGVDKFSGHYARTSKFELKVQIESQLVHIMRFSKMLTKVRKLK